MRSRGLPIRVAAEPMFEAHASASRNGTGARRRRAHTSISIGVIARHTMSFASTRREHARRHDDPEKKCVRLSRVRCDPCNRFGVKAAQPELRGDDHQAEQQRDRVRVNGETGFVEGQTTAGENCNRPERRNAAAIEGENQESRPGSSRHRPIWRMGRTRRSRPGKILSVNQPSGAAMTGTCHTP